MQRTTYLRSNAEEATRAKFIQAQTRPIEVDNKESVKSGWTALFSFSYLSLLGRRKCRPDLLDLRSPVTAVLYIHTQSCYIKMKQLVLNYPIKRKKVFAIQAVNLLKSVTNNSLIHLLLRSRSGFVKRGIKLKASGLEHGDLGSTPSTLGDESAKDFIKYFLACLVYLTYTFKKTLLQDELFIFNSFPPVGVLNLLIFCYHCCYSLAKLPLIL